MQKSFVGVFTKIVFPNKFISDNKQKLDTSDGFNLYFESIIDKFYKKIKIKKPSNLVEHLMEHYIMRNRLELSFYCNGTYGSLYEVVIDKSNDIFIGKKMNKELIVDNLSLLRELLIMIVLKKSNSEHLVKFRGYSFTEDGSLLIIMEKMESSLCKVNLKTVSLEFIIDKFSQIIEGMKELHGLGFFHLDLKPINIMMCDEQKQVKVIDFGLSDTFKDYYKSKSKLKGTIFYMDPCIAIMETHQCTNNFFDKTTDYYNEKKKFFRYIRKNKNNKIKKQFIKIKLAKFNLIREIKTILENKYSLMMSMCGSNKTNICCLKNKIKQFNINDKDSCNMIRGMNYLLVGELLNLNNFYSIAKMKKCGLEFDNIKLAIQIYNTMGTPFFCNLFDINYNSFKIEIDNKKFIKSMISKTNNEQIKAYLKNIICDKSYFKEHELNKDVSSFCEEILNINIDKKLTNYYNPDAYSLGIILWELLSNVDVEEFEPIKKHYNGSEITLMINLVKEYIKDNKSFIKSYFAGIETVTKKFVDNDKKIILNNLLVLCFLGFPDTYIDDKYGYVNKNIEDIKKGVIKLDDSHNYNLFFKPSIKIIDSMFQSLCVN